MKKRGKGERVKGKMNPIFNAEGFQVWMLINERMRSGKIFF
jgi:hypothetical protein